MFSLLYDMWELCWSVFKPAMILVILVFFVLPAVRRWLQ